MTFSSPRAKLSTLCKASCCARFASCLQSALESILTRRRTWKGGAGMSLLLGCDLPLSGLNARAFEDEMISDSDAMFGSVAWF